MKAAVKKPSKSQKVDPLYVIFEQHLCNFSDPEIDRRVFIGNVVAEYLTYLRKLNVTVPKSLEQPIVEELATQVNTMLVKKIYGCLSLQDYQKSLTGPVRRRARSRYTKLSTEAPAAAALKKVGA